MDFPRLVHQELAVNGIIMHVAEADLGNDPDTTMTMWETDIPAHGLVGSLAEPAVLGPGSRRRISHIMGSNEQAGHWLPQEAPDAVDAALLHFLREDLR
jgi:pimeloyl-ACP methyl ester carboxylesterase